MGDIAARNIEETKLYRHLEKAAKNDTDFLSAVKALCKEAESYTTQIVRFFPTFTRHDYTHSIGVCEWMARLLDSMTDAEGKATAWDNLTAEEAALLLLAAYWHDTGMAVTDTEKKALLADMDAREGDWSEYFGKHPDDAVALAEAKDKDAERARILRNYVRERHAARCMVQLYAKREANANHVRALNKRGINYKHIVYVCESHGKWLHELNPPESNNALDLRLCVVLLRLADQLDYDESRAPEPLYHFLNLGLPETDEQRKSREEWEKNMTGGFGEIVKGKIEYGATFTESEVYHGVMQYLKNLRDDLWKSQVYLSKSENDRWRNYRLPSGVDSETIDCDGFDAGDFHITMDQDRVLELLTGENLYDDAGVFVRELLQNSIDAVLARRELDKTFGADAGEIHIYSWQDGDYDWFRIEDDGVGMNQRIIQEHFLKVGHSYYESNEYKEAIGEKSGEFQPISRFGIGILSCFMSDGDNTRLSLSTRRYDEVQPLRMDVNGLHGYYNLAALKPHEREGKPLPAPYYWTEDRRNKTEVRRGVGTTICVRVNRYGLGFASFRELLDRYVVFPTVKITYHEQSASHTYPTQGELMDLVHSLNEPDGTVKTHVFPFSDEMFERVKLKNPNIIWNERPAFTLQFRPLDTLTEGISGVVVKIGWKGAAVVAKGLTGRESSPRAVPNDFRISLNGVTHRMALEGSTNEGAWFICEASFDDFMSLVTDAASHGALRLVLDATRDSGHRTTIAFLGTAAARGHRMNLLYIDNSSLAVLLLGGKQRPTVNLARNEITALPLDTLCALVLMLDWHFAFGDSFRGFYSPLFVPEHFALLPEKAWCDVLDRNDWEYLLTLDGKTINEWEVAAQVSSGRVAIKYGFHKDSVYSHLLFAALNRHFSINQEDWNEYLIALREEEPGSSALPVSLCVSGSVAGSALCSTHRRVFNFTCIDSCNTNFYSQTHPFFKWLLREQAALAEKVPAIYQGLLKTMVLGDDKDTIRRELNDALERLSRFTGDPFHTSSVPHLTDDDFI